MGLCDDQCSPICHVPSCPSSPQTDKLWPKKENLGLYVNYNRFNCLFLKKNPFALHPCQQPISEVANPFCPAAPVFSHPPHCQPRKRKDPGLLKQKNSFKKETGWLWIPHFLSWRIKDLTWTLQASKRGKKKQSHLRRRCCPRWGGPYLLVSQNGAGI